MKLEPKVKCSCGLSKVQFCLAVKSFTKMKEIKTEQDMHKPFDFFEEPTIVKGTKLMTREGNITDYLPVEGVCEQQDCCRKHVAKLEIRGGEVEGIQKGTVRALTDDKETKKKWNM